MKAPKLPSLCAAIILSACQHNPSIQNSTIDHLQAPQSCPVEKEDFKNYVTGGKQCLGLKTIEGKDPNDKRLLIYIHGDNPNGGPAEVTFNQLLTQKDKISDFQNITTIAIARPGHRFTGNIESTGSSCKKDVCYIKSNMEYIADAIKRLKDHYNAKVLILIGYSGGGNNVASIAGLRPDIGIDYIVGLAGTYDFDTWVDTSSVVRRAWASAPPQKTL